MYICVMYVHKGGRARLTFIIKMNGGSYDIDQTAITGLQSNYPFYTMRSFAQVNNFTVVRKFLVAKELGSVFQLIAGNLKGQDMFHIE